MNVDPGVALRKQWFALTPQQRFNVHQRLISMRERMPRQMYVLALQELIRVELTPGRPDPLPCPQQVQPAIGPAMQDAIRAVCMMAPRLKP